MLLPLHSVAFSEGVANVDDCRDIWREYAKAAITAMDASELETSTRNGGDCGNTKNTAASEASTKPYNISTKPLYTGHIGQYNQYGEMPQEGELMEDMQKKPNNLNTSEKHVKPLTDENWQENVNIIWNKIANLALADLSYCSNRLALSNAILELINARGESSEIRDNKSNFRVTRKNHDYYIYHEIEGCDIAGQYSVSPGLADEFQRLQKIEWCLKQRDIDLTKKEREQRETKVVNAEYTLGRYGLLTETADFFTQGIDIKNHHAKIQVHGDGAKKIAVDIVNALNANKREAGDISVNDVDEMRRLITFIKDRGCQSSTRGLGSCYEDLKTENARYFENCCCAGCIANKALSVIEGTEPAGEIDKDSLTGEQIMALHRQWVDAGCPKSFALSEIEVAEGKANV